MAARTQDPERREAVKSSASQMSLVESDLVNSLIKQHLSKESGSESSGKLLSGLFEDVFNVGGGIAGLFGAEDAPGIGTRLFGKQKDDSETKNALIKIAAELEKTRMEAQAAKDVAQTKKEEGIEVANIEAGKPGKPTPPTPIDKAAETSDIITAGAMAEGVSTSPAIAQEVKNKLFDRTLTENDYLPKLLKEAEEGKGPELENVKQLIKNNLATQLETTGGISKSQTPEFIYGELETKLKEARDKQIQQLDNDPNISSEKRAEQKAGILTSSGSWGARLQALRNATEPIMVQQMEDSLAIYGYREKYDALLNSLYETAYPQKAMFTPGSSFPLYSAPPKSAFPNMKPSEAAELRREFKEGMPDLKTSTVEEARKAWDKFRNRINTIQGKEVYK